jgi:hypothetical protein
MAMQQSEFAFAAKSADFCLSRLTGLGRCWPWKAFVQTSPR